MTRALRPAAAALALIALVGCAAAPGATPQQLARGEALYEANCASCHGGATGGDIADIPPRHNAHGHTWHHPDCELIEIVQNGMPRRPGLPDDAPTMPAFADRLDVDDIRSILAHVKTWWDAEQLHFQERSSAMTSARGARRWADRGGGSWPTQRPLRAT